YINHPELRPATKYPPGFPAFLAGWSFIFGDSVKSMKINVLLCFVAAAGLTFLLGRRLIGDTLAALAALTVAISSSVIEYSYQVLSDVPYMLFSLLALYLVMKGTRDSRTAFAGLALCIWAYFTRTAGASLVLASAIFLFLKSRRREAVILLCGFVVVSGLWGIRNYLVAGEGSRYLNVLLSANPYDPDQGTVTFSGLISRAWINGTAYLGGLLPTIVLPTLVKPIREFGEIATTSLFSVLVIVIAVFGAVALRKKTLLISLYIVLYMLIYLGWPEVWRSERFMIPMAPLLAIYLYAGIRWLFGFFGARGIVVTVICALLALTNTIALHRFIGRSRDYPPGWVRYFDAAEWIGTNSDEDAIVLCRKPFLFYLFSNRRTIAYPFTRDKAAMREYLLEARPDYIVLEKLGAGTSATDVYLIPVLKEMTDYLEDAYFTEEPVTAVFRFDVPAGRTGETGRTGENYEP
ncbi:MAG: glycosyltransferase family 39 protein, partial [bacterium]